jgi:hypothetical protein
MSAIIQRDKALLVIDSNLAQLSTLYKECFLAMGRGALILYAVDIIEGKLPNKHNYRKKEEILDLFDALTSHDKLERMIDNYDYKHEGIMTLVTGDSNSTFFVTVKLK